MCATVRVCAGAWGLSACVDLGPTDVERLYADRLALLRECSDDALRTCAGGGRGRRVILLRAHSSFGLYGDGSTACGHPNTVGGSGLPTLPPWASCALWGEPIGLEPVRSSLALVHRIQRGRRRRWRDCIAAHSPTALPAALPARALLRLPLRADSDGPAPETAL